MRIVIKKKSRGFSIVELLIVLAVFVIIMGSMVTIFISIIQNQRRILVKQETLSKVSYAMEYITRNVRSSSKDTTGSCLPDKGDIYFLTHYNSAKELYEGIKFITNDNININK